MSLQQCRDRGHNCSKKAFSCPACGRLFRGRLWWVTTIVWGVIASAVISFMLTAIMFLALKIWFPIL
jgi:hypothetical protein